MLLKIFQKKAIKNLYKQDKRKSFSIKPACLTAVHVLQTHDTKCNSLFSQLKKEIAEFILS